MLESRGKLHPLNVERASTQVVLVNTTTGLPRKRQESEVRKLKRTAEAELRRTLTLDAHGT